MNADPDEGQPTTVPEATTAETVPPETPELVTEAEQAEAKTADDADAAEAEPDATESEPEAEADDAETATAEAEPEAAEPEAQTAEDKAAPGKPEASEPEAEAAKPPTKPAAPEPEPAPTPAKTSAPLVANRYRLVAEIGGGAMGVVWRARDEILGRDVAVKELRPDHGMSGAQVRISHQRARREGRIAARLQHPNAVVIYDVAEHDGRPYLIMEYVPSQSLGDILATGAVLTPTEVTSIGAQLASALTAAHEAGIVHRDIKPGNVLMTSDGTVKLTDFGISRAAGDATVTATGEILGTPAYTAPEVAQGHPVAFPADVFSLGATLYAAVEGIPPFGEDVNAMATLLRVVRHEIRLPKRSGALTDTIMRMLNPEPVDRPTMKQVWQGLDALSTKPLPVAGIKDRAPETRPFSAPSPTLVVTDPVIAKSPTVRPEPPSATKPSRPAKPSPTPMPTPMPTPTEALASIPIEAPLSPSSPTTASSKTPASTPTSAMGATPARNTPVRKSEAAMSPTTPPPPTSEHPALAATAPPPARRSRSRMPLAITILVVGTTVLVVAIVVAMNAGKHSPTNQPVAHGSTSSTPSTPAKPTSTSQATTTPSNTPSSSASSSPSSSPSTPSKPSSPSTSATDTATQMTTFITSYYALIPGNLATAWPNMTEAYQTRVAHGFDNYKAFWGGYQSVSLSNVVATLPSTVVATIHYTDKSGNTTSEVTTFGLIKDGTGWKIDTSHT